jgi:hypothetical protein
VTKFNTVELKLTNQNSMQTVSGQNIRLKVLFIHNILPKSIAEIADQPGIKLLSKKRRAVAAFL